MKRNDNHDWRLEGDYFDGCNCKSICPCIFALDPTEGDCKAVAAWHIEKGHFTSGTNNGNNSNSNINKNNNNSINLANLNVFHPIIARSVRHTYKDHGLEWDNSGRNAFYSRFTYFPQIVDTERKSKNFFAT